MSWEYHWLLSKLHVEIFFVLIFYFYFYFSSRQVDAAKELGISLATLKAACRRLGLSKWPFEKDGDQVMCVVLCKLSLSICLSLSLSLSLYLSLSIYLSLSLSHTHTHTLTHSLCHTHMHAHTGITI
jgi:hypothetical protein